jgi:hypothetical protein
MNSNNNRNTPAQNIRIYPTQMDTQSLGQLRVRCTTPALIPIENATIRISPSGEPGSVVEELTTNEVGLSDILSLPAPSFDYSQEPSTEQPYSEYDISVIAPGHENVIISNAEILPNVLAEQNVALTPLPPEAEPVVESFVVSPHTLFYEYPPKQPEAEIKPTGETGEIVLSRVVVPEFVIVHDGPPASPAQNHTVRFRDYIKNVASSEIYATWPENSIYSNVFAILSFTLNRVYTEWYRNQGYNFTITSSTAYDHKWIPGRNIFNNISFIVDSVFVNYLSRPNVRQPILTQYCDGERVQCPGWLSQWGSKFLGDDGNSAIQILRNYYGNTIYINTATEVTGIPSSWPGQNLTIGSRGESVRIIQEQLNRIAEAYPLIPRLSVDGVFGPQTAEAVRTFQNIFSLPATGVIDRATWYKISHIYVAVTRIAE